jgi:pyruvate dehydrogenase E2 component (dihydrolipoamide acetyltransferase)
VPPAARIGEAAPTRIPEPRPARIPEPSPARIREPRPARIRATPAARRRAAALDIAIETLPGTGVDGAVCLADLARAAKPAPRRGGFDPAAMRAAIAAAMSRSKREIPHYYLAQTVDIEAPLAALERMNADRAPPARILPAALLLRAAARAVAEAPELNGFWENGLVAPAIRHADQLSLGELMDAMRDLVARARGGGLRGSELTDPTITVTSLGERGAESVLPVIHPPQVAILGFGRIVERPWVAAGAVVPRRVVTVTLAADHRASDGHRGGLLLARIEAHLKEEP